MTGPRPISTILLPLLETKKLTQEEAARCMGVSRFTVNQLCNDQRRVTAFLAIRLERLHTPCRAAWWLEQQAKLDAITPSPEP